MQLRTLLVSSAARARGRLMSTSVSTRTPVPQSSSPASQSFPSSGFFLPRCSTSHLSFNSLEFQLAHSFSQFRPLKMAPPIWAVPAGSPRVCVIWNCDASHTITSSRSFIKIINRTARSTEPWDTPLLPASKHSILCTNIPTNHYLFFSHPEQTILTLIKKCCERQC